MREECRKTWRRHQGGREGLKERVVEGITGTEVRRSGVRWCRRE